jgi:hypothetical protein
VVYFNHKSALITVIDTVVDINDGEEALKDDSAVQSSQSTAGTSYDDSLTAYFTSTMTDSDGNFTCTIESIHAKDFVSQMMFDFISPLSELLVQGISAWTSESR